MAGPGSPFHKCETKHTVGSPRERDKSRSGYVTPAFLGADCLVRGGKNKHRWGMVKKKMPGARLARSHSRQDWGGINMAK